MRRRAVELMDAGQFAAVQALFQEQEARWRAVYASTGDADALLELNQLSALDAVAARAAFDPAARSMARKSFSYQAQERQFRSRRKVE